MADDLHFSNDVTPPKIPESLAATQGAATQGKDASPEASFVLPNNPTAPPRLSINAKNLSSRSDASAKATLSRKKSSSALITSADAWKTTNLDKSAWLCPTIEAQIDAPSASLARTLNTTRPLINQLASAPAKEQPKLVAKMLNAFPKKDYEIKDRQSYLVRTAAFGRTCINATSATPHSPESRNVIFDKMLAYIAHDRLNTDRGQRYDYLALATAQDWTKTHLRAIDQSLRSEENLDARRQGMAVLLDHCPDHLRGDMLATFAGHFDDFRAAALAAPRGDIDKIRATGLDAFGFARSLAARCRTDDEQKKTSLVLTKFAEMDDRDNIRPSLSKACINFVTNSNNYQTFALPRQAYEKSIAEAEHSLR